MYPPQARLLPLLVGTPILILLAIVIFSEFKSTRKQTQSNKENKLNSAQNIKIVELGQREFFAVFKIILWIMGYYIAVLFFGFLITVPIFTTGFLIYESKWKWYISLPVGLFTTVILYMFMSMLFKVDLWNGVIPKIIPGFLGGSIMPPL
jgi:hypothetical protein